MRIVTRGDSHIHVYDSGTDAAPVMLVHGFASDHATNWLAPGWVAPLAAAGFRAVAPDMRGHGRSTKFYAPHAYALEEMAADVAAVMEELCMAPVPVVGYSMGGFIAAVLAAARPDLVSRLVLAGVGANMLADTTGRNEAIAQGLEADDVPSVAGPPASEVPRRFRLFADQTGADRKALAACIRGIGKVFTVQDLARIRAPTLVIAGERDDVARDPQPLADLIPHARCVRVPKRDHMRAVGDKITKRDVVAFLAQGTQRGAQP